MVTWEFWHELGRGECIARWDGELLSVEAPLAADEDDEDGDWWDDDEDPEPVEVFRACVPSLDAARRELHAFGADLDDLRRTESRA